VTDPSPRHVLTVGGRERHFLLYVPTEHASASALPLIIALHGGGSTPVWMAAVTKLNRFAEERGFAVAYPAGYRRLWHTDEHCCGPALAENIDDVAFIGAVIDGVQESVEIDAARIFVLGFSNGGRMAYTLGCQLSDRIAALAVGGASLGVTDCHLQRPVPLITFHGMSDEFSPYAGGLGAAAPITVDQIGVPETVRLWAKLNGCDETPQTVLRQGSVTAVKYTGREPASEVIVYTIEGMGHQWPGHTVEITADRARELFLPQYLTKLGQGTAEIDATALSLDFFERHPMPTP
jgi:polyhydroxybutyrate depolymerase